MQDLINAMAEWVTDYGYLAIFLLMFLDIIFPSEVTLMVGGWYAADGRLELWLVVLAGTLGNLAFGWILYALGRRKGRELLFRYGKYVMIRPQDVDKTEIWWEKYGEAATFFSRLIPIVRTLISFPAGIARMPLGKFSLYTVLGMALWAYLIAWLGTIVEDNWSTVTAYFDWPTFVIAALLLIGGVVWFWRRRKRRKALALESPRLEAEGEARAEDPEEPEHDEIVHTAETTDVG